MPPMIVLYVIADTSFPFDLFPMVFATVSLLLPCNTFLPRYFGPLSCVLLTISITIRVCPNGVSILVCHGMSVVDLCMRVARTVKAKHTT